MANKLFVHPAFYRRLRHYRDRIATKDGRKQVSVRFVPAVHITVLKLLKTPGSGHLACFDAPELTDIKRIAIAGFPVFAIFYRYHSETLTIITVEHTAQDLPAKLANVVASPK